MLLALLAIGALVLILTAFRTKTRKTASTIGLLVLMGGIAATLNLAPNRAFANIDPADCVTTTGQSTHPGITPASSPTTPTPSATTPTPSATTPTPSATTPTPSATTPTPTMPAPTVGPVDDKRVQGKITVNGTVVEITDPPGIYESMPATSELFPGLEAEEMDPNGDWQLPTYVTGDGQPMSQAVVTAYAPGPDGIFGTGDDREVGRSESGNDGFYMIPDLAAGKYRVVITLPKEPDFMARWAWDAVSCSVRYQGVDVFSEEPLGTKLISVAYQDITLSDTEPISNVDFRAENNYTLAGGCRGDK